MFNLCLFRQLCRELTLRASVHDELGNHSQQEVLDQADREAEASPVVAVLEDLEAVALEVDVTVKVHLVEGLHGDLVGAMVLETVGLLLELEVVLNGTAGVLGLGGLAGRDGGDNKPPAGQDGKIKDEGEEEEGLEAAAHLPLQPEGNTKQNGEQDLVVKGVGAWSISWEGSILDGRVLDGGTINQLTGSLSLNNRAVCCELGSPPDECIQSEECIIQQQQQ